MGSILNDIKKLLGIDAADTDFDTDLIIHINGIIARLQTFGVGPEPCYQISGASDAWDCYITDPRVVNLVKQYIFVQTRIVFDPPQTSALLQSLENISKDYEFRLMALCDNS